MLLTMLGQIPKNSSTLLLRRALFFTSWLLPFASRAWKWPLVTADFSSPDSLNKHVGSLGCISESNKSRPLRLQSYTLLVMFMHDYVSLLCVVFLVVFFFAFLFVSTMTACLITTWEGVKKATSQISPLKWYVLAGEIYFSAVLLCCNQREWRSDCDSHHQRLMANQTGGLPTLRGFLELSCTLSFSLFFLFIQEIRASHQHELNCPHQLTN